MSRVPVPAIAIDGRHSGEQERQGPCPYGASSEGEANKKISRQANNIISMTDKF